MMTVEDERYEVFPADSSNVKPYVPMRYPYFVSVLYGLRDIGDGQLLMSFYGKLQSKCEEICKGEWHVVGWRDIQDWEKMEMHADFIVEFKSDADAALFKLFWQ